MLTRQGWLVLWGAVTLLVLGRVVGLTELYVFGAAALVLVVLAALSVHLSRLDLEIDRRVHPARVHAGHQSRVEIWVRNLRNRRTPLLRLLDPISGRDSSELLVPPLDWGSAASASYRLPTERRGLHKIGPLDVIVTDSFGLARSATRAADTVEVTVYPRVDAIQPVPFTVGHDPLAGSLQPHALGRAGDDFYALRPYVVGDDLRQIHWPSTARHDELMVRQQEQPWQGRTTVVLDVRRAAHDPMSLEVAVSAAASILNANSLRNDLVRLVTTDGLDSGFAAGRAHLEAMLEHLAVVQASGTASLRAMLDLLHKGSGGALVVILAQVAGDETGAVARLGRRYGSLTVVQVGRVSGDYWRAARAAGSVGHVPGVPGGNGALAPAGTPRGPNGHGPGGANGTATLAGDVPLVRVSDGAPFAVGWNRFMRMRTPRGSRPTSGAAGVGAARTARRSPPAPPAPPRGTP